MKAFRVGDWRLGIKELKQAERVVKCPFGCETELTVPHFLLWCPDLNSKRNKTKISEFYQIYHEKSYEDDDIVRQYLWAMDDDPMVVKEHGEALINMRNMWYKLAKEKKLNLNVKTKISHIT